MALAKDVKFEVKSDDVKLGTLLIRKGNVEWLPSKNSANKFRLSWEMFAEVMKEKGTTVKIKKKKE